MTQSGETIRGDLQRLLEVEEALDRRQREAEEGAAGILVAADREAAEILASLDRDAAAEAAALRVRLEEAASSYRRGIADRASSRAARYRAVTADGVERLAAVLVRRVLDDYRGAWSGASEHAAPRMPDGADP
jgi:vacuolar-type H+-ATPase subunit H